MENEETRETQKGTNEVSTSEDSEARKAKLDQEKQSLEGKLAEAQSRIAELENALSEAKKGSEAASAELTSVKDVHAKAVTKYLEAVRMANSHLPQDVIGGSTIDEIDASAAKAKSIAEAVKKTLEAQAKEAKVPAGAPTRGEIPLEGLSPREKIVAGIQQKGGTTQ